MSALRRFGELSGRERSAYAEAAVLDALFRLVVLVGTFAVARTIAHRLARSRRRADADLSIRAVEASGRVVPGSNCLSEGLTAWVLLTRAGRQPMLRVGVAKGRRLQAHAWVECDGAVVVGGDSGDGFSPLEGGDLMRT